MPIYEYECPCGNITEEINPTDKTKVVCECGNSMTKVSIPGSARMKHQWSKWNVKERKLHPSQIF